MRWFLLVLVLLAGGCGGAHSREGEAPADPPRPSIVGSAGASPSRIDDIDSEREGSDWCQFLGPFGTSVSPEKGIITPWPAGGLRVIRQMPVGMGYGMPAISQGKIFLFDRHGDKARLSCFQSANAELLWKFEYPTDYEDYYGYNNGPRCCPVVDGDRVYIYGVEGMLYCIRAADGKEIWKVDTRAEFHVLQNFFGVGS